jgi:hypothetical protein
MTSGLKALPHVHLGGGSALEGGQEEDKLSVGAGEVLYYLRTGGHHL